MPGFHRGSYPALPGKIRGIILGSALQKAAFIGGPHTRGYWGSGPKARYKKGLGGT